MKIRKAMKKDLKKIAKIMKTEFAKPPFNEKATLSAILKSLNFYIKIGEIYVALIKNQIVGVIVFKKEQFWEGMVIIIEDLVVDKEFKKQGIGKSLMNYVESHARRIKIKSICFKTNRKSSSVKFYQKYDYKSDKNAVFIKKKLK